MSSLITCTLCKKEISSHSEICPHCGHPHKKLKKEARDNKQSFLIAITILLLIGIILLDQKDIIDLSSIPKKFGLTFP